MAHWICFTTATHRDVTGPFDDFDSAQEEMRREARYYRARNGYIITADDEPLEADPKNAKEFACDYDEEILAAANY